MHLTFVKIGRIAHDPLGTMADEYFDRLRHFCKISISILRLRGDERPGVEIRKLEAVAEKFKRIILLDELGSEKNSSDVARMIGKWEESSGSDAIGIFVGGAHGFPKEFAPPGAQRWSLSKLTLQGDLAWVVLAEQLYRGFTILRGVPYHH